MKFLSDILAKAGLTVDGVVTLNNTATGQTPDANDNSTKLATTAWVRTFVQPYSLPIASASVLGGIKVGSGLSIDSGTGVLSVTGASAATIKSTQTFVVTEGQTVYTVTGGYTPGLIDIFLNGVYLSPNQTVATNGTTFTINDPAAAGDIVDVIVASPIFEGAATTTDQLPEGVVNLYYTNARARAAISLTTTGVSGAATYDNVTGVFNIPNYQGLVPAGGNTGDILAKTSATNYDVSWIPNYTSQVQHIVKAGVAVTKGQAVYVSSADGTNMIVSKASNASEQTSSKTLGLVAQNLAINDQGFVVTEGLLAGLDTSTAQAGDPVWLGTDGNLIYGLVNKPYAPAHLVFIGVVTRVQQNNGEIFVHVQNGFELDELHDLSVKNASDGDMIKYVASTGLWTKIAATTTNITEGTNLYYTQARFDSAFSAKSTTNLAEGTNLYYTTARFDTRLATKSTTDLAEGTNLYYTTARVNSDFDTRLATKSTSNLAEGTNLYYTDARVASYLTSNSYATQTYVNTAVSNLVDAAPGTLDTLNELAAALGDDPNFATTVASSIGTKEPIITAGTTSQYWRGDKTWQTLPVYTLSGLGGVPTSRTLTINGTAYDLSADRSWSIAAGVTSFNTRPGAITLTSGDVTGALGYTPYNATNPNGYITGYTETDTLATVTARGASTTAAITISREAFGYSGTTQSFLIDGAGGNAALTINAASAYAYLNFAQTGTTKFEIGVEGAATNKGSLYFNHNIQVGSTGAAMYIKKSNGYIGMGTIDPSYKLHIYTSDNEGIYLQGTGGGVWMNMKSASGKMWSYGAQNDGCGIYNRTDGVYTFFIKDSGLTGIGTADPGYKLHVYTNSDVWHAVFGSSGGQLRIGGDTVSGAVIQSYTPGGTVRQLYLQRDGGSAIFGGTTDPTSGGFTNTKVSIKQLADGGSGGGIHIEQASNTNVAFFGFNGGAFQIGTSYRSTGSYQPISFLTSAVSRIYIETNGYIGINNGTNPQGWLDIRGVDSTTTVSSSLIIRNGNSDGQYNGNQILLGYANTTNYAHAIKTRHQSGSQAGNSFDFFVWKYGDNLATQAGQWVASIEGTGIRIANSSGTMINPVSGSVLTVNGSIYTATGGIMNGQLRLNTPSNGVGSQLYIYSTSSHQYPQIFSDGGYEAMWNYRNNVAQWYVGIRTSSQLIGTDGFHFYNTTSAQTVGGYTINGAHYAIGSAYANGNRLVENTGTWSISVSGNAATSTQVINNTDGAVLMESNASENNNWLWKENAKAWGLFWFNRGSQSGQTIGTYSTVGAELMFMGGNSGIAMPSGWTGYTAGSNIAAMISNWNGYIYSASTVYAATSMLVAGNTVLHAGNYSSYALTTGGGTVTGTILSSFDNSWALRINRSTTSNYLGITYATGGTLHWYLGPREDGTQTYRFYNFNTTVNAWSIDVNGNCTANGDVTAYSDRRIKTNISPIKDALNKTLKLNGVSYNRTDNDDKATKIGFIAQDVQDVLSEVVTYDEGADRYGVSYGNITALLVEAIKELKAENDTQKSEIEELKDLVKQLINR